MSRGLTAGPGARPPRHHPHRSWCHHHTDLPRQRRRGAARAGGREPGADHRREHHGHRGLCWSSSRTLPSFGRFIYVSSGAVYKNHGPDRPGEPLPEDGYVMPRRLYGISKLASELITERYGSLFGLSTASVRPSSVYGPMDRVYGQPQHAPRAASHCTPGTRRRRPRAGEYPRCGGGLRPRGRRGTCHRRAAAGPPAALQRLQRRERCDREHRRAGRMGGREGARLPRRGRRRPSTPTSCRTRRCARACGAPTMCRASARTPAGSRARRARRCMPTLTGWPANVRPDRTRSDDELGRGLSARPCRLRRRCLLRYAGPGRRASQSRSC